jgi:beta-galactosidase
MVPDVPSIGRRGFLAGTTAAGVLAGVGHAGRVLANGRTDSLPSAPRSGRERLSMDGGWRFLGRDVPFPKLLDHEASYSHAKAGNAEGAAATDYDDSDWDRVSLPHDFALGQPYDPSANLDEGYRQRGIGWYRRTFQLDEADQGKHLELEFGGIATHATVWINGTLVHRQFTGFTGFTIDLTPFALYGEDQNILAVRVDATASEAWWYEGAGIYRHVWLTKRHPVHIVTDGVHADPRRAADGSWAVPITLALANIGRQAADVEVEAVLLGPDGSPAGTARGVAQVDALGSAEARLTMPVSDPLLWSPDRPALYTVRAMVRLGGVLVDVTDTAIGFRTLRFDAQHGFFLNGRPLKIQGVCAHQDHAGVGVAVPDGLWDYRLRRLKAMGANAFRASHNAVAAELLDAADRLGILVMAENRNFNASEDALPELTWMVRRDRNHPSIILWSLCNEESLQSSRIGVEMIRRMKAAVRELDDSRPVTAALNGGVFVTLNIGQELDVVGFNYGSGDYDRYHATFPDRPMISSEDTSAYMTRGAYRTDKAAHVLAAYDEEHTDFGLTHRDAWRALAERPFIAGGFAWTGFDYRGEPSPWEWPTASASFGAMDLCGFAKTAFHIRRALWDKTQPVLEIAPHWTWPGREGQPIKVMVITNAERVVLAMNGRQVADLPVDPFEMASVTLPYEPGRLSAMAYRAGRVVAQTRVETTGAPARLRLTPDRPRMDGNGRDAMPVTVELLDAAGRPIPTADHGIDFTITGGTILGVGNGDPNSHEPDLPDSTGRAGRRLFNGLAQVIVQAGHGAAALVLTAKGAGIRPVALRVPLDRVPEVPAVQAVDGVQSLTEWRTSPASADRPDPNEALVEGDMNSWGWLKPGSTQPPLPGGRYCRFRVAFRARAHVRRDGGRIVFGRLGGRAEIWLDGSRAAIKADPGIGRVVLPLPPGDRDHVVTILFDAPAGSPPFGIAGTVDVETGH